MIKVMKRLVLGLVVFLLMCTLCIVSFLYLSPQFGGSISSAQQRLFEKTGHYTAGKFLNLEPFKMELDCHSITTMLKKMWTVSGHLRPKKNIEVQKVLPSLFQASGTRIIWMGHSSFLILMDGKKILIDPVWSAFASPHPWIGQRRYNKEMPIALQDLPEIDALLISHDHYDHLDYQTIVKVAAKTKAFIVPLGIGSHLRRWGVKAEKIVELDWWQSIQKGPVQLVLTPSRHMSGRSLTGQSSTLWGSWILKGRQKKIFFSGDGGYGSHFKKIGAQYGPFDIALIECGQYSRLWPNVHLMPEKSVQVGFDVRAKRIMPIHWGAFTLAYHTWTEPVIRFTAEAKKKKIAYTTPKIGEPIHLETKSYPTQRWWEAYMSNAKKK